MLTVLKKGLLKKSEFKAECFDLKVQCVCCLLVCMVGEENIKQKTWCCHISPPPSQSSLQTAGLSWIFAVPCWCRLVFYRPKQILNSDIIIRGTCFHFFVWSSCCGPCRRDATPGKAAHHFWAAFLTPFLSTSKLGSFFVVFIAQREIPCHHCPYKKKETGWGRQS